MNIRNLTVSIQQFGRSIPIIKDLNLEVKPGEVTVLLGASGSGKSSLAALILGVYPMGLYNIVRGEIFWREKGKVVDLAKLSGKERRIYWGRKIGQIFQEPDAALNPVLTISSQLKEVASNEIDLERVTLLMDDLGIPLGTFGSRYPWQLSGGQQQRTLLAMTLIQQPDLLLADEPTAALDRPHQKSFLHAIKAYIKQPHKPAILLITHDIRIAREIGDTFFSIEDGICNTLSASDLNALAPVEKAILTHQITDVKSDPQPGTISAQELTGGYKKGETIIQVEHLEVHAGEMVGISGPSGSGKSSLLRAFLGLLPWQKGTLSRDGELLEENERRQLFSLIYQDPGRSFNPAMTIREAFNEVIHHRKNAGPDASYVLAQVEMPEDALDRWPHQFSGGQKQRLAIARALLTSPKLLLCDEPFSSLDAELQSSFLKMLAGLCHKENLAVLLVAHDLPRLRDSCDRILLMDAGRVVWEGQADALSRSEKPFVKMLLN